MDAMEVLAECWASMDGKLDAFKAESHGRIDIDDPNFTGHYVGYCCEAEEIIRRLEDRGFKIVPKGD